MHVISQKMAMQFLRYRVSDGAVAAIWNTYLAEEGIIKATDTSRVIDRNLVRRWKYCVENQTKLDGLYFDGKLDNMIQNNGTLIKKISM